ncbi:hypothetical protein MLGJGCBP_08088 [Rhodococcus sp. T7]|nr:hypothetical protein MLGJGCBP_08088 [Rhodococcus sp. T7]
MRKHLENTGRLLVAQALRTEASDRSVDEIWSAVV